MPVTDLHKQLGELIYLTIQEPIRWEGDEPDEDSKQQTYDEFSSTLTGQLLELASRRVWTGRYDEWQEAFNQSGKGSTFIRAEMIAAAAGPGDQQILAVFDPVARTDLAGGGADDGHRRSAEINEALLTGLVPPAHGALLQVLPVAVTVTELRVTVAAVGVLPGVLLPQQLLGHPLALEFLVDDRPVRYLEPVGGAGVGAGIEQPGQPGVIQFRRQRPAEPQGIRPGQQLLDGADADFGAGFDLPDRQPGGVP